MLMGPKKIFLNALLALLLVSCTKNLSQREPYLQAIGKQFVLQQDVYIYYFNDYDKYHWLSFPCKLRIGQITPKDSFFYNLPSTVEEKHIGTKNSEVTLKGILWKGSTFTIKRIVRQKTVDNCYYFYLILPNQGFFKDQEINPSDFVNIFENPPYTPHWSDPPIFDPKYALPLPADGVWWK